ncbi:MAG: aldo/keto reductase [Oscillospiraceae bacterium]|nr:aldo/keto reductase [Oscillospiraceae bacterium]
MNYRKLNNTELSVSPVCMGTVNYGTEMSEYDAKAQMSKFLDDGGNFLDTAQIYGEWGNSPECFSEYVIGNWFKETGNRQKVVLATKGAHPKWGHMDKPRVNAKDINEDLEGSLKLLNTDYIDLYFLHRDDPNTPVTEIMECLDAARKAGKIRHYGCSNWKLPRIKEAQEYSKSAGLEGFVCNQLMWSLADINFYNLVDKSFILMDEDTHAYSAQTGMNVMAYMSVAKGYFTRRAAGENLPAGVADLYNSPSNDAIFERLVSVAKQGNYTYIDMALMYIIAEKLFPAVPIASFDNMAQLKEGVECMKKTVPAEIIEELSKLKKFTYWE